jgi:energy-coupling factor transport system permease protein
MRPAHRRIDPRAKIAFAGVVVLLTIIIPRIEPLAALGVLLVLVVAGGRGFRLRSWLSLLSPFKVLIPIILVLNAFFYGGGTVLWSIEPLGVALRLTTGGIEASIVIAGRLLVIAGVAAWFAATTDAETFEVALTRLGVPASLAFVLSLTVRLVPELRSRYEAVEEAQRARGLVYEGGPISRARARIPVFIPFFVSIIRFGYELGDALLARGYGGSDRRTYQTVLSFERVDAAFSVLAGLVFVAFALTFLTGL